MCGIALFRFLEFFLFHSQQTGNTVLLHGDTVEYAGFFHGTPAVRHQNKLGGICKVLQILCIAAGVVLVCFGVLRGEVDTVFSKAIKLCLECVGIG